MAVPVPVDAAPRGIDLGDPAFWRLPEEARVVAFARLRERSGPVGFTDRATGRRCWALVRHADVTAASRAPEVYLSGPGVTTPEPARWVRAVFGDSMVNLDDPRHADLRRVVGRAFTPRLLAEVERDVRETAVELVDRLERERPTDFVPAVAAELPFRVICTMMGIPPEQRRRILARINLAAAPSGVARGVLRVPGRSLRALAAMQLTVAALGRERRRRPTGDLISALVTADVDGRRLNSRELGAFFSLLLVAGVETTRNALAHGLHLLTVHPEQRALLLGDLDAHLGGAVEEIVRYSTPIVQFRRTVAVDHRLSGIRLAAGDKVVLFYGSANRDEAVFRDPDAFDITRSPNPHLGFGGGGPHFCLGAHLARQEMRVLLRELFTRLPEIRSTAAPETVPSSFDHRVRSLPFTF
ncbi:methyl-branched lipid omega-hydroxylase [Kitasatospora phosalacinea]|uniref:Methyl-branched lipid omega-hydroxylase n=1 Tax=Kitasatospora phosalacinea TaxID=2065 RepID=A0A9W6UXP8_9ACTN|nr:cytochrome P450 [Kitasatospora phosalacinea]GLW67891.1 methyl-branched lipid omega-hydroxylase [Kitasatospora phosalacinea]